MRFGRNRGENRAFAGLTRGIEYPLGPADKKLSRCRPSLRQKKRVFREAKDDNRDGYCYAGPKPTART